MLSRPSSPQYASSPVERLQAAAIFGMLGSFLGVLGLAAGLWLYQLHGRIQEQADAIRALAGSVDQVAAGQRLAVDTLLGRAGVEKPSHFAEQYGLATKARDEARRQLVAQQSINETLGSRTRELESQALRLTTELEEDRKLLQTYEADAKKAPELRQRVAELEQAQAKLEKALAEKTAIADTADGEKAAETLRNLNLVRYAAYFFGALSVLLGLAVGYLYYRPLAEPDPGTSEPLPHRIT